MKPCSEWVSEWVEDMNQILPKLVAGILLYLLLSSTGQVLLYFSDLQPAVVLQANSRQANSRLPFGSDSMPA